MAGGQLVSVLHYLHRLRAGPQAAAITDGELLDRFVARRDEDAFAALVGRHGPMVYGVCRRLLRAPDAEDAFQATFLALAQKAATLRRGQAVAAWLHEVARHVAARALEDAHRRRARERQVREMTPQPPLDPITHEELRTVLDEEMAELPAKYKAALLLCDLEGRTHLEAARELNCPPGSVSWRLARARGLLRRRLARRGISLSAAALVAVLAQKGSAAVPVLLALATVRAAVRVAATGVAGLAPAVASLTEEGVRGVCSSKIRAGLSLLLAATIGVAGTAVFAHQGRQPQEPGGQPKAPAPAVAGEDPSPVDKAAALAADLYGDPLPPGAAARLGTTRLRHGSGITSLAFAPDGKTIASASNDHTVRVWDIATGKESRRLEDDQFRDPPIGLGAMLGIEFAPDGKTLAIARLNRPPCLWDIASGKILHEFGDANARASWIMFSPEGRLVVFGGPMGQLCIAEPSTGKVLRRMTGHPGSFLHPPALAPDGKTFATSASGQPIQLWDVETGKALRRFEGIPDASGCLAFSPDSKTLASGSHANALIRLWDVASGKEVRTLSLKNKGDQVCRIVFRPDGKALISGHENGMVRFWDTAAGQEIRQFGTGGASVGALAVSPDGKVLATSSRSPYDHAVQLWDTATGKSLNPADSRHAGIAMLAFSPDSRLLAAASWDGVTRVAEAATGKPLHRLDAFGYSAFLADSKALVTGGWSDGKVRIWDLATGTQRRESPSGARGISCIALAPDGKTLVTAGYDSTLRLWDLAAGRQLHDFGGKQKSYAYRLALTADGRTLASIHQDFSLTLWEVATGKQLRRIQVNHHIGSAAFSPRGNLFAFTVAPSDGGPRIVLHEVATGKEVGQLPGHGDPLDAVAFSPDGRTLIWGGQHEKVLRQWEVRTRQERRTLEGHQGQVTCLAFAPNGKWMASGSADGTALIWDALGRADAVSDSALADSEREALWADLAGENAGRAADAMSRLARSPQQAVDLVRQHLRPVPAIDAKQVVSWLQDLDSDQFETRERASQGLAKLGEAAETDLRKALERQPPPEARRRIEFLLKNCSDLSPERLRADRALELLEHLATPEARRLLQTYAEGCPGAWLTQEAKATLERLGRR